MPVWPEEFYPITTSVPALSGFFVLWAGFAFILIRLGANY